MPRLQNKENFRCRPARWAAPAIDAGAKLPGNRQNDKLPDQDRRCHRATATTLYATAFRKRVEMASGFGAQLRARLRLASRGIQPPRLTGRLSFLAVFDAAILLHRLH